MCSLGQDDLDLLAAGRHEGVYDVLGARPTVTESRRGTTFAVWAPAASRVSVVGDFNAWSVDAHPLAQCDASGVWSAWVPDAGPGQRYMFAIHARDGRRACGARRPVGGRVRLKADPYARAVEVSPGMASVITRSTHRWGSGEDEWRERRLRGGQLDGPLSVYEVHLGSWRRVEGSGGQASSRGAPARAAGPPLEGSRPLSYRGLARELPAYVRDLGFTHVELMPVMAHPFVGSWGYQVTGYYAPNPAFGSPDDLRGLVQALHEHGLGVILDWVPAHFARDDWALADFDGGPLYEHPDPGRGRHAEWGTRVFNLERPQVRNFLIANALYWLREFHVDGLRVDAVSSMLYSDHARDRGEWITGRAGEAQDPSAAAADHAGSRVDRVGVGFLRELTATIRRREPGALCLAEEATAWPGVTRPPSGDGLGFDLKWNMGWAHDTLTHLRRAPTERTEHHHELTFGLVYAFDERFILPLSHDEMAPDRGSLYERMPGAHAEKLAALRALYAHMWAHPGKKLLFMGAELAQTRAWSVDAAVPWELLSAPEHAGVQALVADLNHLYREHPALWSRDFHADGFRWLEPDDAANSVLAFIRLAPNEADLVAVVANLSHRPVSAYRVGLPRPGAWRELINTAWPRYTGAPVSRDGTGVGVGWGAGAGAGGRGGTGTDARALAGPIPWHGQPFSTNLTIPALTTIWLTPADPPLAAKMAAASGD